MSLKSCPFSSTNSLRNFGYDVMTKEGKEDQENVEDPARVAVEIRRKSGKAPEDLLMRILLCLPVLLWPHALLIAFPYEVDAWSSSAPLLLFLYAASVSFCTYNFGSRVSFWLPIIMFLTFILVDEYALPYRGGGATMWPVAFVMGSIVCSLGSLFSAFFSRAIFGRTSPPP